MRIRGKLLLAAAALFMVSLLDRPAEAGICLAQPYDGFYNESDCANYCYQGGCYFYEYIGTACYCS